jgi:hypothetical protein
MMNLLRSIIVLLTALALSRITSAEPTREIGIEGGAEIALDRGDYRPKPLDDRTPLILRIDSVKPADGGRFIYQFHYIGFEPGPHKLADYLVKPDGNPAVGVGDAVVTVRSVLPASHDGSLTAYVPQAFPWIGGYRMLLWALGVLWVLGLLAFWWFGRRRKIVTEETIVAPPPGYAERMRPLVEAAAAGDLTVNGQAELERLMTGYWREKLALPDSRMAEALAALKRHPEAGALLRAMERWLHRPGGVSPEEIRSLLEPYQKMDSCQPEVMRA